MESKPNHIPVEFLLFIALGLAYFVFHTYRLKIIKRGQYPLPPGPKGLPIIGCILEMTKKKPTFRWIHKLMQEMNTEIACIRLGGTYIIPVTSPELSKEFLKKQDAIFASRPDCMSGRITSNGYLTSAISPVGDQWKKMKRILVGEVLSPKMHHWLGDKRCEEADHLVKYVHNQCTNPLTNGLVNVRLVARHYAGNLMRKMIFNRRFFGEGAEDGGPGSEEIEYVEGSFTILSYLYCFGIADYLPWLQAFDLDGHKKILVDAVELLRKYHHAEISKRVEMWGQGIRKTKEDILDVFINLKDSTNNPLLSIQEIEAQILEMVIAIIDNPSNAIEWCLAEMINQPYIFQRARQELDQVVGRDRLVNESDLSKLNYIKACIKEAFRLHPVAPFNLPHVSTTDLTVGGYLIPKGSHVLLSRHGLGRNPRVWESPLEYKPERHIIDETSEVVLTDPDLTILSFSIGRRGCPAYVLGSTTTTILLARLIQAFDWSATNVELVESEIDLFMANPLIARADPRLDDEVYKELLMKN